MHKVLAVGVVVAAWLSTAQAQTLELDGIGVSRDVPCNGLDVIITGNGNQFRLAGDCGQVEVGGSEQQVSFGEASSLVVTGVNNRVEAERVGGLDVSGSEHRIDSQVQGSGQPAQVALYGEGHVLDLDLSGPVQIEVNGIGQQLTWRGDEPQIETSGVEHRIERD
ncbi:DUF3060 domain-containing protein [Pseudomonas mendocina]|nr:DUF3060 domain-containing protein [Pseudomonas mendocina]MBH3341380.1 DUF3060 domain-containing protein [Pseudomonas mendocina]